MKKIVIALGGNALQEAGKPATAEAQLAVVEKTAGTLQISLTKATRLFWRTATVRRSDGLSCKMNMRRPSARQCPLMSAAQ